MATIWNQTQPGAAHTHVLILGIGAYRHLNGVDGQLATPHMDLGQLTSPPVSARKFADWVLNHFENDEAPLGSVELLLSELQPASYKLPDQNQVNVDTATIDNIEEAFYNWLDRCDEHSGNVAIFYFCGHGVMVQGDILLLAEDYGRNSRLPFGSSINFTEMHQGVITGCKAGLQCYFVDACSYVPVEGYTSAQAGARNFITSTREGTSGSTWPGPHPPRTLVLRAAAPGTFAYGRPNKVSRFTDALVQCLDGRGCAAQPERGKWVVTNTGLPDAVHQVIQWMNETECGPIQIPTVDRIIGLGRIHTRDEPPVIPVIIQFEPPHAIDNAVLVLEKVKKPSNWRRTRAPKQGTWEPNQVEVGSYILQAHFNSGQYENFEEELMVTPPGPVPKEPFLVKKEVQ